jgi:hypothetical protein
MQSTRSIPVSRFAISEHDLEGAVLQPKAVERQEDGQQLHSALAALRLSMGLRAQLCVC